MNRQRFTEHAMSLRGVEQHQTWGHPTFRVGGRIFASLPDESDTAVVKATPQEQAALIAADPRAYAPAPRVGRHGWLRLRLDRVDAAQVRELVHEAWTITAPRHLLDDAGP